jgi:hypothetical protein
MATWLKCSSYVPQSKSQKTSEAEVPAHGTIEIRSSDIGDESSDSSSENDNRAESEYLQIRKDGKKKKKKKHRKQKKHKRKRSSR